MQPGIPSVFKVVNRHARKFVPAHHDKLMELFSDDVLIAVLESPTSTEWVFQEPNVPVVVPPAAVSKDIPYVFVRHPNISDADCDSLGMLTSTKIGAPLLSTPLGLHALVSPSTTSSVPFTGSCTLTTPSTTSSVLSSPTKAEARQESQPIESIPFPLTFVCDMAPGMEKLHGRKGAAIECAFLEVFPQSPFKQKTVYKHIAIYSWAVKKGLLSRYINYGATKEGYWTALRNEVEKIKAVDAGT